MVVEVKADGMAPERGGGGGPESAASPYVVDVKREDGRWIGEVRGLVGAHTSAGSLLALDGRLREAIALVGNFDIADSGADGAVQIEYVYADQDAAQVALVGSKRRDHAAAGPAIDAETRAQIAAMRGAGFSIRDMAHLLSLSPARVAQIEAATKAARNNAGV
jgi:hypothetical protein